MYHATRIELKKLPSVANHTVRSAFSRNTNIRNPELPNMDAVIYGHVPSKKNVRLFSHYDDAMQWLSGGNPVSSDDEIVGDK